MIREYQKVEKGSKEVLSVNYHKAILDRVLTGLKLRRLRLTHNLTHEELADLLQLKSPRVIYDWESGIKFPNVENLFNLALIFKMKMEDLLVME